MSTARLIPVRIDQPFGQYNIDSNLSERIALVCTSVLFAGLTREACLRIASSGRLRNFARDEVLFNQGHPIRTLVLLQSGVVKLTQLGPTGNEVILWLTGSGETVTVPSDSPECSHTCSARAMQRCVAMTWEYGRLRSFLEEYPEIRKNIGQILSSRLNELEERFREVATEKVAKRVALTLLRLMKHVGTASDEGVEVSLSREELAQMTGTTLFTISRILSKWAEEGLVVPRREAVLVRDAYSLRRASNEDTVVID